MGQESGIACVRFPWLRGTQWISGSETTGYPGMCITQALTDGNWYCDAGIMSIPLYDGREARFRLETVHYKQGDEEDLVRDDPDELDEEDTWDTEEFEDEEEE